MTDPGYSSRARTAVLLCGVGTAGVYQAGALKALEEAGVKIDVVAGHGPGAGNAALAAVDGTARLWDEAGPWLSPRLREAYRWRAGLRVFFLGLWVTTLLALSPLLVLVAATGAYALGTIAALLNVTNASASLVTTYQWMVERLFDPPVLPTIVPRAVVLSLLLVGGVLVVSAVRSVWEERNRRRIRGGFWWRLVGEPLQALEPGRLLLHAVWAQVRGASTAPSPGTARLGQRYVEVLTDNLGQPGFRELVIAVHDLDARRDAVGAVLAPNARGRFAARRVDGAPREAEAIDLLGTGRTLTADLFAGACRLPFATAAWPIEYPADGYWRGERHRICDRPELPIRLVDELAAIGVEQLILVGAAPAAASPHGLRPRPASMRGRLGEAMRAIETAAFDDALAGAAARFGRVFAIRPSHNPIGPFDFAGTHDDASDRRVGMPELLRLGYDDAYRAFIEPAVAAGDQIHV